MSEKVFDYLKAKAITGSNVMTASRTGIDWYFADGAPTPAELDKMLASAVGNSRDVFEARSAITAAMVEPIQQIIPYIELYDRFFMQQQYAYGEDSALPLENRLTSVAYSSHPNTGVEYVTPGFLFVRPTFQTWTTGAKIPWNLMQRGGWNILSRQMNYLAWEMARKRDTAAKAVIDAAVPVSHQVSVSSSLTKTAVDTVIRGSNQIGYPVKIGIINPSRLMEMQAWTWGGTGFYLPPDIAHDLVDNLYYGQYGGVKWFAHPNVPVNTVYLGGAKEQIGYHQTMGTPRSDSAVDITQGADLYTIRDADHAWHIPTGLALWTIQIT